MYKCNENNKTNLFSEQTYLLTEILSEKKISSSIWRRKRVDLQNISSGNPDNHLRFRNPLKSFFCNPLTKYTFIQIYVTSNTEICFDHCTEYQVS